MSQAKKYIRATTRERLIRKLSVMTTQGTAFERELLRQFKAYEYNKAAQELNTLISEGYVYRLGMGRRGDPYRITLSATWPFNKCPLCGHIEFPASTKTPESVVMS